MKNQASVPVERKKMVSIIALYTTSIIIILLGTLFCVYSFIRSVSLNVMNFQVHGAVFGVVVAFLGVRYLLSVQRLKAEVYKTTSRFSWSNFRKTAKK